jgi:hypothetical protein
MNCKDLEILLSAYANDELPAAEMETVNGHLAGCANCKTTLSAFQEVQRQILSLKDISVTMDVKDAAMTKIKKMAANSPAKRWTRRALVAVPVAVIIIALEIVQPWATKPSFQDVMAKSYLAVVALKSYRTELTLTYLPAANLPPILNEVAYVAPDRYYTKTSDGTKVEEVIKIGEKVYYKTTQEGTVPQVINPDSSGLTPDMGNTFRLLNTLHDLKTLKDEVVDGSNCYHYRGDLYLPANRKLVIDIWVGKEDNLPRKQTQDNSYTLLYFDLNKPIIIEPPLTSDGELQAGWHILSTSAHLTVNFSNSIGGADLAHSSIKYDINLYNDGLQEAKNVHVTIQTIATNNSDKPAILEAVPSNIASPVNIASWQSLNFGIEWEFDAGSLSKIELVQLIEQTTITVTYQTDDGTVITDTYPKNN